MWDTFTGRSQVAMASPNLHALGWPFCFAKAVSSTDFATRTMVVIELNKYYLAGDLVICSVLIGVGLLGLARILKDGVRQSISKPHFLLSLGIVLLVVSISSFLTRSAMARSSLPNVGDYVGLFFIEKQLYLVLAVSWAIRAAKILAGSSDSQPSEAVGFGVPTSERKDCREFTTHTVQEGPLSDD
jgi:TM2 domain-containing membrane protein YozV